MRRWTRLAAKLYPAAWRARYGAEFEALLEEAGSGWRVLGDVLKGAFDMQFSSWGFGRITAITGAAGLAVAALVGWLTPNLYISNAVVSVSPNGDGQKVAENLRHAQAAALSDDSLASMIQQFNLYPNERKTQPMADVVADMRNRRVMMAPLGGHRSPSKGVWAFPAIEVRFADPDAAKAQAVNRELTRRLIAAGLPAVEITVLDASSLPQSPAAPNRVTIVLFGLAIGTAAGLLFMGARRWPAVALAGIGGMVAAFGASFLIPERWTSMAVVHITPPEAAPQVVATVRRSGGVDAGMINANPGTLYLRADGRDRMQTRLAVRQSVTRLIQESGAPDSGRGVDSVVVLDPASLPRQPSFPNRFSIAALGLLAGMLAGVCWRWTRTPRETIAT